MINLGNIKISDLRLGASQVKAVYFGSEQVWGSEEHGTIDDWLCFTAEQDGSTLRLDKVGTPAEIYLEISVDEGVTWKDYAWSENTGGEFTNLNIGDKVYFRAKTENQTIGSSNSNYYKFVMTGKIAASGNIQALLKADGSRTDAPANCYYYMFYRCGSLTQAPELPAATLADRCYFAMFNGCTSLTTAPDLPATTLASECYRAMFQNCTSLTTAPELPATTLAISCYRNMFSGCTSLTTAQDLPATTLASECYRGMFQNCTSLTIAPVLPATTLISGCYNSMFSGCTSLTSAPELPATTLASSCYASMFQGCSNLASINVSFTAWDPTNATAGWVDSVAASGTFTCPQTLIDNTTTRDGNTVPESWTMVAYDSIPDCLCFTAQEAGSTVQLHKIGSAPDVNLQTSTDGKQWTPYAVEDVITLANANDKVYFKAVRSNTEISQNDYAFNKFVMTGKIAASGNLNSLFEEDEDTARTISLAGKSYCYYRMFQDCTSLTQAPELPATILGYSCYNSMFEGCTALTQAPALPATTLANNCYQWMFYNCTSLTQAPELPATTLANNCYQWMFSGCSSLTQASELPATTLADNCYNSMFYDCTALTQAPALPATTLANNCYQWMFYNCTSLTQAPALPATTLANNCYSRMFSSCTSLTQAPTLPATTLANNCYTVMFDGCKSLSSISVAFTAWGSQTNQWLRNVAATGTFTCPAALPDTRGTSNIPEGWTKVDAA